METRFQKHRAAVKTIESLLEHKSQVLVVHYSCESFYERPEGRSARITSIAVRNLDSAQTYSFSIHQLAEKNLKTTVVSDADYDKLEKQMLEEFFEFYTRHDKYSWIHWNMRDINYGFPALAHRLSVLGGSPPKVDEGQLYDFARILIGWYGPGYSAHPRLKSLMDMNKISDRDFLSGADEAKAFEEKQYVKLHQSTLRKVDIIANVMGRLTDGSLRTNSSCREIYGGWWEPVKWFLQEHWIVALISFVSSVLGIIALFWHN